MGEKRRILRKRVSLRPGLDTVEVGPPATLAEGLAVAIDSVPKIYEKDVEKGAKIALALLMYYDPANKQWYPAQAPQGLTATAIKAYKPDTNTYEYPVLDAYYNLLVREYNLTTPVYQQLIRADETVAQSIVLDTEGRSLVSIYVAADAPTNVYLDVSSDNTNWFNNAMVYSGVTSVSDTVKTAFRYVRLRSDAAGVSGNKITLALAAKVG
jgi:hypothetical protein